jgi:thiamine-monophosphate kinase
VAINVTVVGCAPGNRLKYRSGARPGDIVVVNGTLGESAAGLRDILEGHPDTPLAHIHRNPAPQVEQGAWLGTRAEVRSMMDISDGLASDLAHILRASGVGAQIELSSIPAVSFGMFSSKRVACNSRDEFARERAAAYVAGQISDRNPQMTRFHEDSAVELAATGGEDYKLLFTVAPEEYECLAADYLSRFGTKLHPVGKIVAGTPEIIWTDGGAPVERAWRGFVHF